MIVDLPMPTQALTAFASFVRARLADVGGALAPYLVRAERADVVPARPRLDADPRAAARQLAMVIVTAAGPFAPNSHARARLLRQAHASGLLRQAQAEGLLTDVEADQAIAAISSVH
jgi:hypothetical protein